ncbi:MAG TPA: CHAT domain-containing protein [Chthoniobacterales bacterium]|nr:CHAT domain-containing protein [Chthoniobacterales bacterium]
MNSPLRACKPKSLTPAQEAVAVQRAIQMNPANAATARTALRSPVGRRGGPRRLALLIENRWPKAGVDLSVQFLDNPPKDLRKHILEHMNAWTKSANVRFRETTQTGLVRIARLDEPEEMAGYWSYVGTQILGIDKDEPTFNLEGFTMRTPESEFHRVVRHEAGHTLGFEHEHMRTDLVKKIDRKKAFVYFDRTQGWTAEETTQQVLTPLAAGSIMGTTESDPLSIMCYQIPGEITKDGKEIPGGTDINAKDFAFAAKVYPKTGKVPPVPPPPGAAPETPPLETQSAAEKSDEIPSRKAATPPDPALNPTECDTFRLVIMDEFDPEPAPGKSPNAARRRKSDRPKYARILASYAGAQVSGPMRLRADKAEEKTAFGSIISVHERIKAFTNRESGSLPNDKQMVEFGSDLFEALFVGDVRRLYDEARSRQHNRKLDIVLTSMIPWIAEKPWEFAYDKARRSFLATEEIHMVRNVVTTIPANVIPPRSGPLRILVAAAQPVGLAALSVDDEVNVIRRGFAPLEDAGLAEVKVIARATPRMIHGALSTGNFTVVHFIGHGIFDETDKRGALFFEDDHGGESRMPERSVREVFCKRGVKLIFLNSCESGRGARDDSDGGIAQALVSHGVPAVVANQYSVLDSSATSFAQHFYWALTQGMSIGQAACEARIAVNYSLRGDIIDWAVPVVYTRDPNMVLCAGPVEASTTPATTVRGDTRRAMRERPVRVAVWDIDSVFPLLERTLERMNDVQKTFGFEVVALSAPIDAWDLENRAEEDNTPYLWAEKLAHRLGAMAAELQVDVLACITKHWMRDNEYLNLYGWWPEEQKPPIVIFSVAGLDLATSGPETERAIANVAVSALTGFFADMGTHVKGPKDCPLFFDRDRDTALLTGRQKFDAACRTKLKRQIPDQLPALESLLKAFP